MKEVWFWPPEVFRSLSVLYQDHRKGSGGPTGGYTCPKGPYGLNMEGNQPLSGTGAPPLGPMHLGLGGNPKGGAPLAWGASPLPLAAPL